MIPGHQIKYMHEIIIEGYVFIYFLSNDAHFQNTGSSRVHLLDPITVFKHPYAFRNYQLLQLQFLVI